MKSLTIWICALVTVMALTGCAKKRPLPVPTQPTPTATTTTVTPSLPPPPPRAPQRVEDLLPVPAEPVVSDALNSRSLDDLNRDSPLKPVFFPLDASDLDDTGRAAATANADILKKFATWAITIEGHCDERGSTEYNLALGERRALTVKTYLVSLGVPASRVNIVSYGKEYPFDTAHTEAAWADNRRAQFVVTAK